MNVVTITMSELKELARDAAALAIEEFSNTRLIGAVEASKQLNVSFNTFAKLRLSPNFPDSVGSGKYRLSEIKAFARNRLKNR